MPSTSNCYPNKIVSCIFLVSSPCKVTLKIQTFALKNVPLQSNFSFFLQPHRMNICLKVQDIYLSALKKSAVCNNFLTSTVCHGRNLENYAGGCYPGKGQQMALHSKMVIA